MNFQEQTASTSATTREERLARRISELTATDQQFAATRPDVAVSERIGQSGPQLGGIIRTVLQGYAERPALGQRAVSCVKDPVTGRSAMALLPRFDTLTYRQVAERVDAVVAAWAGDPVHPGDRVCILGFGSVDYAIIDLALLSLGAASVPLQASAAATRLQPIVAETEPTMIAASVDYLPVAVALISAGCTATRLVVFDYRTQVDDHREALEAARKHLSDMGSPVVVELLEQVQVRGAMRPAPPTGDDDPLALLIYTSGSTGTPKGAMYRQSLVALTWLTAIRPATPDQPATPSITLNFRPLSHIVGRVLLYGTLSAGGTAYFVGKQDLSTFLEDLSLVAPTQLDLVPRVWEMLFENFQREVLARTIADGDGVTVRAEVMDDQRRNVLGGRYVAASTGSAPMSAELRTWVEEFTDMHLVDTFGLTESLLVLVDGHVQRPPVIDYKLVDVPELGYFGSDRPHPRGELAVKSITQFAGYYKRPELTAAAFDSDGYYLTGDIMAEVGPDQLSYIDRRNNVLKLSQGEFITASTLETTFGASPLVRQIYIYANSARAYPLAVVVPTEEALWARDIPSLRASINESLRTTAKAAGLQSYELPRGILIETTPFAVDNGLLTDLGKPAQKKLRQRYGAQLEQLYAELAEGHTRRLRALRDGAAGRPVHATVRDAAAAILGVDSADVPPAAHFADLGGDSLSALTFGELLADIFGVEVPVGVIVGPAGDLPAIATYIDTERRGSKRPTFATVHGRGSTVLHATDLTLDKFLDSETLSAASELPDSRREPRTVLLTGATGFLGRYLALDWLERMALVGGRVICLVRARSDTEARARLDETFAARGGEADPQLLARYRELATDHLEVIAGDKGEPDLGLDPQAWRRLADTVDLIVDAAALVNHLLPYRELFGPNTMGTAELIRIALTSVRKPYVYVSTIGVGDQIPPALFVEDADIRQISAVREINDDYANGYGNSKWAGEVLLHHAHDRFGLPVSVMRCGMILADTTYAGQLNLPDVFTRTMLSLAATGIAPKSFYQLDARGDRQRAHYDGLPVEFVAAAISTLGAQIRLSDNNFQTHHVINPHDDGIGLDEYVDWLIDAGCPIQRVEDYETWLQRFESALRCLPERQRRHSLLPLLQSLQKPATPLNGSLAPADLFRAAIPDIPHISRGLIVKYLADLRLLGLL